MSDTSHLPEPAVEVPDGPFAGRYYSEAQMEAALRRANWADRDRTTHDGWINEIGVLADDPRDMPGWVRRALREAFQGLSVTNVPTATPAAETELPTLDVHTEHPASAPLTHLASMHFGATMAALVHTSDECREIHRLYAKRIAALLAAYNLLNLRPSDLATTHHVTDQLLKLEGIPVAVTGLIQTTPANWRLIAQLAAKSKDTETPE